MFEKSVGGAFFYRSTGVSDEGFERFESQPYDGRAVDSRRPARRPAGGPPGPRHRAARRGRGPGDRPVHDGPLGAGSGRPGGGPGPGPPAGTLGRARRVGAVRREPRPRSPQSAEPGCSRRSATVRPARSSRSRTRPDDGTSRPRPPEWHGGYLDAIEWRWIKGGVDEAGPGVVWMRPPGLVEGEPISPVQRLLACVDSASGASAALDVREWGFLNTELTVHVLRPPVGRVGLPRRGDDVRRRRGRPGRLRRLRRARPGRPLGPGPARRPALSQGRARISPWRIAIQPSGSSAQAVQAVGDGRAARRPWPDRRRPAGWREPR